MINRSVITKVHAREVLDSRGNPTVACRVTLRSGVTAEAKVPSGASTGTHEAHELRDGGSRYGGKGVQKAVKNVNGEIARKLRGMDARNQKKIDEALIMLDGTKNKSRLGANAILAVSFAVARANAIHKKQPLWKSLRTTYRFEKKPRLPVPFMNVLNGGAHANWSLDVQECMIVPKKSTMRERIRVGSEVFHALKALLAKRGLAVTVGDEGGFAPKLKNVEAAFELLVDAIKSAGYKPGKDVFLATDVAANEWWDTRKKKYALRAEKRTMTADQLTERYLMWQKRYPLFSIEDPFAEDDWAAWSEALPDLKKKSLVVGDDLFVTNEERLERGIEEKAANAILIKPNQIGTLSETVQAIKTAQAASFAIVVSHRSGETSDTTIADLAVACGAEHIKTGSLSRSDRVEKYNRLMEIEEEIG